MTQPWSLFVNIDGDVREYALAPTTRVGRDKRLVDVVVRHAQISRHHFTIHWQPEGCSVENVHKPDNNPKGDWARIRIFVNHEPVPVRQALREGDVLRVKNEDEVSDISFTVGPSQSPIDPKAQDEGKPWWKFW